ncbi:MAG: isoprenylcysteine carboxylmethyltransferase family protein [Deltaproteobacteria bacterium]|nr:isoprenylcysteine carboxylmethyltransferase family protein [Deltaproteobacteria bacterium]
MSNKKLKQKNGEHPKGDAGQLIFLVLFLITWILDSFFLGISTFMSVYIPLPIRLVVLALIILVAIFLSMSGHEVVNHEHRPTGIVSTGAFKYVRHPLYLASLLTYLGLAISTASWISFLLVVIIGFTFYNYIAGYEEMLLEERFGDDYMQYKRRTGKWVPGSIISTPAKNINTAEHSAE